VAHRLAVRQVIRSVAAAVAVGVALLAAAPAQATFPGANGKIAFMTDRNAAMGFEIYAMNPDGSAPIDLTNSTESDYAPEWSPDGTKIAFSRELPVGEFDDHQLDLYVMNADGTGQTRLTDTAGWESFPTWSPDGTKIAFQLCCGGAGVQSGIYTMNADGTDVAPLTLGDYIRPAWSPDGSKVAFMRTFCCTTYDILVVNADGSGETNLTNNPDSEFAPNWSPDGSKIAYSRFTGSWQTYTMNPDGSSQQPLALGGPSHQFDPVWSPDGARFAFTGNGASSDIFTMAASGSDVVRLTTTASQDFQPDWQPAPRASYEHPQSAPSLSASLVPTFRPCGTGTNPTDGQHSPPLGVPSCLPPIQTSSTVWVGPNFTGTASIDVRPDSSDFDWTIQLTDVRQGSSTGIPNNSPMSATARIRVSDHNNCGSDPTCEGPYTEPGTGADWDFPQVPIACSSGNCSANTSANALVPGYVVPGKQVVIDVFRLHLGDGFPGGQFFAQQGIYIP
jgi:Tol biopolymer transport system component